MTPQRLKAVLLLVAIVASGLALLSWTQAWFDLTLTDAQALTVRGDVAAPAVSALALSGLVLVGALAIAGPVFRVVLGVLGLLLGATIALSAALALADPALAARPVVTEATGIAGDAPVVALVAAVTVGAWGWVALAAGLLLALDGLATAVTARRWPGSSRRYRSVRVVREDGNPVDDWDSLSEGHDPT